jgi:hypothetical protein
MKEWTKGPTETYSLGQLSSPVFLNIGSAEP